MEGKTLEYRNVRKVRTFRGDEYYLELVMPSGKLLLVDISEIDYCNLMGLERG